MIACWAVAFRAHSPFFLFCVNVCVLRTLWLPGVSVLLIRLSRCSEALGILRMGFYLEYVSQRQPRIHGQTSLQSHWVVRQQRLRVLRERIILPADNPSSSTSSSSAPIEASARSASVVDSISTDVQNAAQAVALPSTSTQMAVTDAEMHTLMKLLSRPTLLKYMIWDSSQEALPISYGLDTYNLSTDPADFTGIMDVLEFPLAIFAANPVVLEKASLFSYIKADIEIEVKVNASPFAAGALGLHYLPYLNEVQQLAKTSNLTLPGLTSCPYVKLVLGQTNSIKLKVPWINEFDMFDMTTSGDYFGSVFLSCLSPLGDGSGAPTATVSLFARFINPEVRVPTNKIPTARGPQLRKLIQKLLAQEARYNAEFFAQGPEGEHQGPISRVTEKIATVSGALSDVPVIGAIARPVSWIARVGNKIATVFGLSKPLNQSSIQYVDRVPARGYTNLEGFDNSVVLGGIPDNAVNPEQAVNESVDQMSIDFVKSQSNIFETFLWRHNGTAFAQGRIASWAVHPTPYQLVGDMNCQFGSLGYLSTMASYWRGGLNFTLTFVATRFHAGRLIVVYFPNGDTVDTPEHLGDLMSTNYHAIIDLNEINADAASASSFTFNVPYVQNQPWLHTCYPDTDAIRIKPDDFNGVIAVYKFTDLIQPDTCEDKITVLVSMSGADDFELGMPRSVFPIGWMSRPSTTVRKVEMCTPPYPIPEEPAVTMPVEVPAICVGTPDESPVKASPAPVCVPSDDEFVAHGSYDDINGPVHQLIENVAPQDGTVPCMGEYFKSLRAFAKRSVMVRPLEDIAIFRPGFFLRTASGRYDETGTPLSVSPLEQVANLFRFSSGSVRYKVKTIGGEVITSSLTDAAYSPLGIQHESHGYINNIHEVNIPYYHPTRLKSHNSNSPRIDDKRVLFLRNYLPRDSKTDDSVVVPAYSTSVVTFSRPKSVSIYRLGNGGVTSPYNYDLYISAQFSTPGGERLLPVYEHGQWVMPTFNISEGQVNFTNNSASEVTIRYTTSNDTSSTAQILESAGDDWSATFMVPPSVVHTRDYQVV